LSHRIALLGGFAVPTECLRIILVGTFTVEVHVAKIGFGMSITLIGGLSEPPERFT
jgi:hypothetical protein